MIHSNRSKEAFKVSIEDWAGILVSDGYGVYRKWVGLRQTCLAHLIRKAKELSERKDPDIKRFGLWATHELQRLCHMAKAPPSVGEWQAFYARLIRLITLHENRKDDAGRFARRLRREIESLWTFLSEQGVDPTNNHAERMLRFAVLWRKSSQGTSSEKGNRWVERILSLRQTCRLRKKTTFPVLVDALRAYFRGQEPDLAWIAQPTAYSRSCDRLQFFHRAHTQQVEHPGRLVQAQQFGRFAVVKGADAAATQPQGRRRQIHPEFDALALWREFLDRNTDPAGPPRPAMSEDMPRILAYLYRAISRQRLELYPDVKSVLEELEPRFPLAAVSDGQSVWAMPELRTVGIDRYFSPIVISSDNGFRKPDPRLYHAALAGIGAKPKEVLFVGNDMYRDVFGAAQMGMKTVFFASNQGRRHMEGVEPDYIIYRFAELREAIRFFERR